MDEENAQPPVLITDDECYDTIPGTVLASARSVPEPADFRHNLWREDNLSSDISGNSRKLYIPKNSIILLYNDYQ